MRIDRNGNVGIGTTSPTGALTISKASSDNAINLIRTGSNTANGWIWANSDKIRFGDDNSGNPNNTRMCITTDTGRVGIGTSLPQSTLQLNKTPPTAFGSPFLSIGHDTYTGSGMYTIAFGYELGSGSNAPAEIGMVTTSDSSFTKGDLVFATRNVVTDTAPTERMRIDSSGNLLVGKTSTGVNTAGAEFTTTGQVYATSSNVIAGYFNRQGATGTTNLIGFRVANSDAGTIQSSAGGTPAFAAASDQRLKDNITDHESELSSVMALRPVRWDWKDEAKGSGEGFVAQELEQTAWADLVSDGEDGYKMVSGLGAVETRLIKALQEAVTRIETLEAEVAALKGE